jgi:hypothetical protein
VLEQPVLCLEDVGGFRPSGCMTVHVVVIHPCGRRECFYIMFDTSSTTISYSVPSHSHNTYTKAYEPLWRPILRSLPSELPGVRQASTYELTDAKQIRLTLAPSLAGPLSLQANLPARRSWNSLRRGKEREGSID